MSKLRGLWGRCSLRFKLPLVTVLMGALLGTMLLAALRHSDAVMDLAYRQEEDYYTLNHFQTALDQADASLAAYLRDPGGGTGSAAWRAQCREMQDCLDNLRSDPAEVGVERHLLAQSIRGGFEAYCERGEALLAMWQPDGGQDAIQEMYRQYYKVTSASGYLQQEASRLQHLALDEGQDRLAALRRAGERQQTLFWLLAAAVALCLFFLIWEMASGVISPVLRLSEASRRVSRGEFDIPDVPAASRDEIYTLTCSFNEMKHSMGEMFGAMEEKAAMEQALHQKELEASENRRLLEQARTNQLRSQINPHFLFNTLNIISRMARLEHAPTTEKLSLALARLFRYNLKTDDSEVPLEREIKIVDDYLSIQTTRFPDRVALRWRISPQVDPSRLRIPSFVLQPIVENSVLHGLEPKRGGGVIRVRIHLYGGKLHLIVSDNGVGMSKEAAARLLSGPKEQGHVNGIGVNNVRSRLLLYPQAKFRLVSSPGRGTCVHMTLPALWDVQPGEGGGSLPQGGSADGTA